MQRRLRTAHAWIGLAAAAGVSLGLQATPTLADKQVALARRALQAGAGDAIAVAEAQAWVAALAAAQVAQRHREHHQALRLARLVGLPPDPLPVAAGPPPSPSLPAAAALRGAVRAVDTAPAVRLARLTHTAARARRLEQAAANSTVLSVGGQLEVDSPLGVAARLQIGLAGAADGATARERSALRAAEAAAAADIAQARHAARHALATALHEVEHTTRRVAVLRDQRLPALRRVVELLRLRSPRGEGRRGGLLAAQRVWLRARLALAEADAAALRARLHAFMLLPPVGAQPAAKEAR